MTDETTKIVNDKLFAALIKAADENKTKIASLNDTIGERIKSAVDNGHLHAGAFKMLLKLYRWDEEKRDEFLRQFDLYRDKAIRMGLFGEEHVGDLADMAERANEEAAERGQVADNVHRLEARIKQLPPGDDGALAKRGRGRPAKAKDASEADEAGAQTDNGDFEDDATSENPSIRNREVGGVGDAEGSYRVQ